MNNIFKGNIQKKALLIITKFAQIKYEGFCSSHGEGLNTTVN